jgi:hypothetical protein
MTTFRKLPQARPKRKAKGGSTRCAESITSPPVA